MVTRQPSSPAAYRAKPPQPRADLQDVLAGREPGPLGDDRVLAPAARRRATGRASRRRRSSRSSSRRGTGGRSRCPGRSAPRCSGGCRSACSAAPDARASGGAAAGRATSRPAAPAPRDCAPRARAAPARSGLDHRPSMYASPAPVSPPSSIRTSAAASWIADLGASARRRVAEDATLPSGRTTVSRPTRIRARRRARPAAGARPGARAEAIRRTRPACSPAIVASGGVGSSARAAPWRWNGAPRSHRRSGVPVDQRDRLLRHERVAQSIRSSDPVGQRPRRRTRLVPAAARRPGAALIAIRRPTRLVADTDRVSAAPSR